MNNSLRLPPLALYIHLPWCLKKCPYCDFNSHEFTGVFPEQDYTRALIEDLQQETDFIQGRPLQSIFFGGGTPSLFSADSIQKILEQINKLIPFAENIEITLEANPGTFEQKKFSAFRQAGINRLSIGIQSFSRQHLSQLGRVHDDREALRAAEIAHKAGFENFNLDLMFGLPGQTSAQAMQDLRTAVDCQPTHLSWYQLTIEPNTLFYRKPPSLPPASRIETMQDAGIELLNDAGFKRYEVSAFSKSAKESRHNLNYWRFGDYLGIGAGAHGKITLPQHQAIYRTRKSRQPRAYLDPQALYRADHSPIPEAELPLEFMMNALRLTNGVDLQLFEERTGLPAERIQDTLLALRTQGLLHSDRIAATDKGLNLLNSVLQAFMD